MDSVEFRGNPGDLERFTVNVLKQVATVEALGPFEHRVSWEMGGSAGFGSTAELRSGLKLASAKLRWERPWAFRLSEAKTPLKFMLCRGTGPRMTVSDGTDYELGGGVLHVRRSTETASTACAFVKEGAEFEQLALELEPQRLRELYGGPRLPELLEKFLANTAGYGLHQQPMTPALSRLLDELLYSDARGGSRQLLLEAKGLELLAILMDELTLASLALAPLGPADVERLERARRVLLARMACPPALPELAREVGLNEFKLKSGFRELFGTSVFGYLRAERMERARRLLAEGRLNVSEVAGRVGYANPSKFASAFRKHFGVPPSAVR
jgi:AraC-like DNA-binding protein